MKIIEVTKEAKQILIHRGIMALEEATNSSFARPDHIKNNLHKTIVATELTAEEAKEALDYIYNYAMNTAFLIKRAKNRV
jgi:ABC-type metal ion transport system substrate-binding protein